MEKITSRSMVREGSKYSDSTAVKLTTGTDPKQESTAITKAFLRTGLLPPHEDSTFVTVYEPGERRRPIVDPYCVPTGFQAGDIDSV